MDNVIVGFALIFGLALIGVALIAKSAIDAVAACGKRESETAAKSIDLFHRAAQASALHATMVKNERIVEAEINLEGERLRFGSPDPDHAPATSRYYDPSHVIASDMQGAELRTVNASGTGVD